MCAGSFYLQQCGICCICYGSLPWFPSLTRFCPIPRTRYLLALALQASLLFVLLPHNHIHLDLLEARLALSTVDYHRNVQVSMRLNQWSRELCFEQLNCPLSKLHRLREASFMKSEEILWKQKLIFLCSLREKKEERESCMRGRQRRNEKVNGNVICLHG